MTGALTEEDAPIDSLVENPRNPNIHPEDQLDRLMASLRTRGQNRPVLARKANRMLIGGHGVRMAAKRLGWTHIRVALWDVDQATADQAMLADNRLAQLSSPNHDRVAELLREMPATDWLGVGFSVDEATKLMDSLTEGELEVREIDTHTVNDQFWITVRGPLVEQAHVLQHLKDVLQQYGGVSVELGTVAGLF